MRTRRHVLAASVAILASLLVIAPTWAQPASRDIPVGAGSIVVEGAAPDGGPVRVWTYRPNGLVPADRIIFVMHGVLRNADVYRDNWIPAAQERRFLLVVPEMTREAFPGDAGYNFGNMVDKSGTAQPRDRWAWRTIERVFDAVRTVSGSTRTTYAIFGHSAGAQFVHRMVMYADNLRVDAAIAANAGWYTMPVFTATFPYGLAGSPIDEARVKANFAKPLVILLGDQDNDPQHVNLRRDAGSDAQGLHRFARGQTFIATAAAEAKRLQVPFAWRVETVPGVGHDNAGMTSAAVRWLFDVR